ncbi:MAG TPA: hypothetical protein VLK35_18570 [Methylomirabilota bacterium]|nr:hypothetical protein [Methylomirabilota bacterium]
MAAEGKPAEPDRFVPHRTEGELAKRGAVDREADTPWAYAIAEGR